VRRQGVAFTANRSETFVGCGPLLSAVVVDWGQAPVEAKRLVTLVLGS